MGWANFWHCLWVYTVSSCVGRANHDCYTLDMFTGSCDLTVPAGALRVGLAARGACIYRDGQLETCSSEQSCGAKGAEKLELEREFKRRGGIVQVPMLRKALVALFRHASYTQYSDPKTAWDVLSNRSAFQACPDVKRLANKSLRRCPCSYLSTMLHSLCILYLQCYACRPQLYQDQTKYLFFTWRSVTRGSNTRRKGAGSKSQWNMPLL